MEKKKENAFKQRLVSAIKSSVVRNLIIFGILILSVFCMLLLDEGNYVRTKYMAGLSENFIADLLDVLNVQRYNIGLESWLIFFTVIGVVSIFLIANMFSHLFVDKMVEKKGHKFNTEKEAKRFYTALYYLFVLIFSAVVVFIFIMAGGFDMFREEATGVFVDLLYTLLICLIFGAIVILALALVGLILRGIFGFISLLATGFVKAARTDDTKGTGKGGAATADGGSFKATIEKNALLDKDLFPALTAIDNANAEEGVAQVEVDEVALDDLVLRFQSYACNNHKIYYELPLLRSFIAGMAASRLIILEGLSGTGKSLLPRMFARFTNSDVFFSPVQATWRDKTDVLGFYSEFTKTFKITDFLRDLYSASYTETSTLMVLDEMNLSRIEYYFADFLSILEYPQEEWKIKVYEPELGQKLPVKLTDGYVTIPANTWFVGTANTDDSTFTITDKVYDRAITLDFRERISPITSNYISDDIHLTAERLQELFNEAKENEDYCLSALETEKFLRICDFIRDAFDIRFGNRIMVQINQFVPVYVALGGTKEAALDFMLASKVLRKLDGMFEDYVKDELIALTKLINSTYGKGTMVETERIIAKILKRLV